MNGSARSLCGVARAAMRAVAAGAVGVLFSGCGLPADATVTGDASQPAAGTHETPRASPSQPASSAVVHEANVANVYMTAELADDHARDREPIHLTVTVENRGKASISWARWCYDWSTDVSVRPKPMFGLGRAWEEEAYLLKRALVSYPWVYEEEYPPYSFGPAAREPRASTPCFAGQGTREKLAPGEALVDDLVWLPEGPMGMPMPAQAYEVAARFHFVNSASEDLSAAYDDLVLTFDINIDRDGERLLLPGEAVDVLLEDARLWQLLEGVRRDRWLVQQMSYVDGSWVMVIRVGKESARLEPDFTITAEVDARTGELTRIDSSRVGELPPVRPVSDSAEIPGVVRFTLRLDRDRTAGGQPLWAELVVENIGSDEVLWATTGGCPPWPTAKRDDAPERPAFGREDWPGDAGTLKSVTVDAEADLEHDFVPEEHIGTPRVGCDLMNVPRTLAAGERRTYRSVWYAETAAGIPVETGAYHLEAELRVVDGPLRVRVPVTVTGFDIEWLSPGEALDRLLAEPAMQALLLDYPRNRWNSQELVFENGRWKLRVYVSRTPTDWAHAGAILGTVDALDGHVYGVRFDVGARPAGCEEDSTACDP